MEPGMVSYNVCRTHRTLTFQYLAVHVYGARTPCIQVDWVGPMIPINRAPNLPPYGPARMHCL